MTKETLINLELQLVHLSTGAQGDCRFGECKWYTDDLLTFIQSFAEQYAVSRCIEELEKVKKKLENTVDEYDRQMVDPQAESIINYIDQSITTLCEQGGKE